MLRAVILHFMVGYDHPFVGGNGRVARALEADEDAGRVISYRRLGEEPGSNRLDVLVRHVVNHSSYHRGQVTAFLRNLGRTPPSTDLVLWDRLRSG